MLSILFCILLSSYGSVEGWPQDAVVTDGDTYNYVIVGAGSAGAILANRLSEDADVNVLLLEAGGNPPNASIFPGLLGELVGSEYDWNYASQEDDGLFLGQINPGVLHLSRGKMLGGTSGFNYMFYVRGYPDDFNSWANSGLTGWDWESVFPYFLKSEGLEDINIIENEQLRPYHNTTGPVKVSRELNRSQEINEKLDTVLQSFSEIGIDKIEDYNDPTKLGVCYTLFTHSLDGIRSSTAQEFLSDVNCRSNLAVVKNAVVSKVIFKENVAIGTEVVVNNKTLRVFATNEVILSAGAFNTPKILISSGVGPETEVKKLNPEIPLVVDLPVGEGLQDHLMLPLAFTGRNTVLYQEDLSHSLGYFPFPSLNGFLSLDDSSRPNIQVVAFYFNQSSPLLQSAVGLFGYNDNIGNSFFEVNKDKELVMMFLVLLHPKSRGTVNITNSDLNVKPEINLGYFSDSEDLTTVIESIRRVANFTNTSYFKSTNSEIVKVNIPSCDGFEYFSDDYLSCYIRNMVLSIYHPLGTCAMGKVVDTNMKVYGVNNLRVIDGSAMPYLTSGNINAPIMMMAEKIADYIKNSNKVHN